MNRSPSAVSTHGRPPSRARAACLVAGLLLAGLHAAPARAQGAPADSARAPGDSTATLAGRVMSAMTGGPLINARVVLVKSGYGAFTDSTGAFRVPHVPAGLDTIEVSLIGFADAKTPLVLKPGATTRATFLLSQTVLRVEELHVEVEAPRARGKLAQFEEHRQSGLGYYITPEMIEERHAQHSSDLLRMVPGLTVGPYNLGHATVRVTRQAKNCSPPLFVDGVLNPGLRIDDLNRDDIMAIEVYRGASETPAQYQTAASGCGAILVWTQQGGSGGGSEGG